MTKDAGRGEGNAGSVELRGELRSPEMLSRSFLGGLWQRRHWQTDGRTYTSATKGSHGNRLLIWRFDERLYRERGE